ncbi:MFS transporter [Blastomyces dermatitidis ER-3]|uniref:MFS transporter n=1 Tax=Ajellomyces dermatitidis (strain ER-3 / ATCC MYA-2586) TaxID=559297 RepID=A0ABP2ES53_AJEDR|nr:MFS transporter [Blastomyces dermatitidis ER-3]EEQ86558.2 MFS transporter [Blastomyces dermatitidis ER-3]
MDPKTQKPKLPVQQFIVLSICRFAEPVIFTSVFPYLPEMIRSLGVSDNEVAKWVGLTSAIFSVCQGLTAVAWGAVSDRIGRKPVIISGLCITMSFSLLFGFSTSLPMAILARACVGLGNGNVGIIRTIVAELVPEKELQPRAFSLMPLVWTIGSIFGPAFGGALADPAKRHKEQFGHSKFFKKYPYALPNMAVSVFFIIGILTGLLFLQETLASKRGHQDWGLTLGKMLTRPFERRKEQKTARGIVVNEEDETTPLLTSREPQAQQGSKKSDSPNLPWSQILIPQSNLVLLAYATMSMHTVAFDSVFTVFLNHKLQDYGNNPDVNLPFKFSGGFGIDAQQIGILYTINAIIGMLTQFFIFPRAAHRYGVLNCLKVVSVIFPMTYLLTPFTVLFPSNASRQIAAFLLMCSKLACVVFAFPCSIILLTNSAKSMSILGSLNGVATSASAVGKAIGPAILGGTFSLGVKKGYMILPWWTLAFIASLSALPVFWCKENDHFSESADTDGDDNGLVTANGNEVERGEASHYQEDTDGETRGWEDRETLKKGNAGGNGFVRSDQQYHKGGLGGRRAHENGQEDD